MPRASFCLGVLVLLAIALGIDAADCTWSKDECNPADYQSHAFLVKYVDKNFPDCDAFPAASPESALPEKGQKVVVLSHAMSGSKLECCCTGEHRCKCNKDWTKEPPQFEVTKFSIDPIKLKGWKKDSKEKGDLEAYKYMTLGKFGQKYSEARGVSAQEALSYLGKIGEVTMKATQVDVVSGGYDKEKLKDIPTMELSDGNNGSELKFVEGSLTDFAGIILIGENLIQKVGDFDHLKSMSDLYRSAGSAYIDDLVNKDSQNNGDLKEDKKLQQNRQQSNQQLLKQQQQKKKQQLLRQQQQLQKKKDEVKEKKGTDDAVTFFLIKWNSLHTKSLELLLYALFPGYRQSQGDVEHVMDTIIDEDKNLKPKKYKEVGSDKYESLRLAYAPPPKEKPTITYK